MMKRFAQSLETLISIMSSFAAKTYIQYNYLFSIETSFDAKLQHSNGDHRRSDTHRYFKAEEDYGGSTKKYTEGDRSA